MCRIKMKALKLIKFLEFFYPFSQNYMKTRARKRKGLFGEDDTVSKMWIKTIPPTPFSKLRIVFFRS